VESRSRLRSFEACTPASFACAACSSRTPHTAGGRAIHL
jgi:hypothetical protein